jgi:hypothetical protein
VAHAKLVPDVGVGEREIGHHQVGDQQLLEHVGADVARALLLIRAKHIETRRFQRRPDQFGEHPIEINLVALAVLFHAERHCNESV